MSREKKVAGITVARMTQKHGAASPQVADARRALATAKIAEYVEREVAKAPPLTDAQVERIGVLLRSGRQEAGAA